MDKKLQIQTIKRESNPHGGGESERNVIHLKGEDVNATVDVPMSKSGHLAVGDWISIAQLAIPIITGLGEKIAQARQARKSKRKPSKKKASNGNA